MDSSSAKEQCPSGGSSSEGATASLSSTEPSEPAEATASDTIVVPRIRKRFPVETFGNERHIQMMDQFVDRMERDNAEKALEEARESSVSVVNGIEIEVEVPPEGDRFWLSTTVHQIGLGDKTMLLMRRALEINGTLREARGCSLALDGDEIRFQLASILQSLSFEKFRSIVEYFIENSRDVKKKLILLSAPRNPEIMSHGPQNGFYSAAGWFSGLASKPLGGTCENTNKCSA